MMWWPFSGRVVVGGRGRGNPWMGGDRACLQEFGMGGFFAVPLTKWRIPNGGGFLKTKKKWHQRGYGCGGVDTLTECGGGQSLRGGVGGADLNPRLFLCKYVLFHHLDSFEDVCGCVWVCVH